MIPVIVAVVTWLVLAPAVALVTARFITVGRPAPAVDPLADVPVDCLAQAEIDARFRQIVGTRSTFEGQL